MEQQETQNLCSAATEGDRDAASRLMDLHYPPIFQYLRRLCGSDADAADLTQLVFRKAWKSLSGFRGAASFPTWLHRIAFHVYLDWRRKPDRSVSLSDHWWASLPSEAPTPFESAIRAEEAGRIFRIVDGLEDDARQAVHLHYYQGLSLRETAEVLGIATSTLKYRLRGALEIIRRSVETGSFPVTKGGDHD